MSRAREPLGQQQLESFKRLRRSPQWAAQMAKAPTSSSHDGRPANHPRRAAARARATRVHARRRAGLGARLGPGVLGWGVWRRRGAWTVFTTKADGRTTVWVVADRRLDGVCYARVAPGHVPASSRCAAPRPRTAGPRWRSHTSSRRSATMPARSSSGSPPATTALYRRVGTGDRRGDLERPAPLSCALSCRSLR